MHSTATLRHVALKVATATLLLWLSSCADNAGVAPRQSRFGDGGAPTNTTNNPKTEPKADKNDPKSDDSNPEPKKKNKKKSGFERSDGSGGDDAAIEFPQFKFNGEGRGPCKDKNYPVVMNVTTTYSEDSLEIRKEHSRVICSDKYFKDGYPDGKCEESANSPAKLARRNVTNTFVRLSKDELKQAKEDGVDIVPYAVFAKEVRISDGRVLTFSKPLPVGIVPAAKGRYKDIDSKSWQATVSGSASFDVVIEISLGSSGGGSAELQMTSTIPQAGANWSMYDDWVLPTAATYSIDTEEATITGIKSRSKQSGGGDKCNKYEESSMTLTLCERIQGGETTAGSCSFGQNPYP